MPHLAYIDLGMTSAEEFWTRVVLPDFDEFAKTQSARHAHHAAVSAWHIHDWIFNEQPASTKKNDFQKLLIKACPELGWLRDYAETLKHRGLARPSITVKEVLPDYPFVQTVPMPIGELGASVSIRVKGTSPVTMVLEDGTKHQVSDVLQRVIGYWQTIWFPRKL
jgi:hypothetical protein